MKRIIPFVKDIDFNSNISEVTGIALEHNLKLENDDSVVGNFNVSGKYKTSNVSINEQNFEKVIPFDITLDDKYDSTKITIDIDDFYYEIINEKALRIHIDVLVDNLVYKEKKNDEVKEDNLPVNVIHQEEREINDNMINNVLINNEEEQIKTKENLNKNNLVNDLYETFKTEDDNYITYKVHIIRENETIDNVLEKYNITKEELEKYNALDNILLGSKIIVPLSNEQVD